MKLYGYWRSLAAYRVRVALAYKCIPHEVIDVDLAAGAHRDPGFLVVNPQGVLPALDDGRGHRLFQSMAILEFLEEAHPSPPLLPADPAGRARVRGLAQIHAADVHPLLVPRVRGYLQKEGGFDDEALRKWLHRTLADGMGAIEAQLAGSPDTGRFCHGDAPTFADICLSGQWIAMQLFGCDTAPYSVARRIVAACEQIDAFAASHPLKQPGAPTAPPQA